MTDLETMDIIAVKENSWNILNVHRQTPEICLAAVSQNGSLLKYVEEPTPEVCMAAVKQNGLALHYVEKQTDAIIMEAIRQNPAALQYVKNQTVKQCIYALSLDITQVKAITKNNLPEVQKIATRIFVSAYL